LYSDAQINPADVQDTKRCTKCGGTNIIIDNEVGEEVCGSCGLVLNEGHMDTGPEWRAFTAEERSSRSRTGMGYSYTLYDKGLSTVLSGYRDANGKTLKRETLRQMDRLRKYDNRSKFDDTWRRNLSIAMAELDRMSALLHIPGSIKERSALLYRKALRMDLIRGRSIDAFVAASIYATCRLERLPRPLKQISAASTREHSEIARTYRLMLREMDLKMPIDDPMKFVPSIASKLNLRRDTETHAIEILRKARKLHGLSGKEPRGIAAASLYKACLERNDKRVQKEVAEAAGTTEVTLRNRLRGIETLFAEAQSGNG
jgi:transcription initiation factor TFIIB